MFWNDRVYKVPTIRNETIIVEKVIHDSTGKKAEENILCQKDQKIEMIEGCWRKQKNCIENQGHNQEEDLKIGMKEE